MDIYSRRRGERIRRLASILLGMMLMAVSLQVTAQEKEPDVIYVPTPDTAVQKMMEMADVGPGDYVIDLGSGDGRIVLAAAKRGAYAHGVEIDPDRLVEARRNADNTTVEDQVLFIKGDLFEEDFSRANVIMMYLLRSLNLKLRPRLIDELDPGTPVVSHSFNMGDWKPDKRVNVDGNDLFLWYVPADVDGIWTWKVDGKQFRGSFRQKFQRLGITMQSVEPTLETRETTLDGERVSFIAENDNVRYVFSGKVESGRISGLVQIHKNGEKRVEKWDAVRE